jgi:hypothetical protein
MNFDFSKGARLENRVRNRKQYEEVGKYTETLSNHQCSFRLEFPGTQNEEVINAA